MKLQVCSDLHLEFDADFRPENHGADVLILSGDICVAEYFTRSVHSPYYEVAQEFRDFFEHCSREFKHVIYVKGNHESYKYYIDTTIDLLKKEFGHHSNIHILENEYVDIDDVRFIGSTLWTDGNRHCPLTDGALRQTMNDFNLIQWSTDYRKFTPRNSTELHAKAKHYIDEVSRDHDKVVLVGHHAPTFLSIHEKYKHDYYINGGYASDLSEFILDRPQIKLWTHGHVHNNFDYYIGTTRVFCNPKGYKNENPAFDMSIILEI